MDDHRRLLVAALATAGLGNALPSTTAHAQSSAPSTGPDEAPPSRGPDVVFVPTPQEVVEAMLSVASVGPRDVLYDLGSGDGRIPITAAKRWGTRGVGIDIDPNRVRDAQANARGAGVTDRVKFVQADLFETDLSEASVITLYLLPALNLKLRPTLLELKPGTRIVSHDFPMGDWKPLKTLVKGSRTVYFWTVPDSGKPYPRQ